MRPCPFCNSIKTQLIGKHTSSAYAHHSNHQPKHSVRCMTCRARGPIKRTENEAISAWNEKTDTSGLPLFKQE